MLVGVRDEKIRKILSEKRAWPLPKRGEDGWRERRDICRMLNVTEWQPKRAENDNWQLIDPELPITQSEIEESDDDSDDPDSS